MLHIHFHQRLHANSFIYNVTQYYSRLDLRHVPLVSTQAVIKFAANSKHNLHVKDVKLVELRDTWCQPRPRPPHDTDNAATRPDDTSDKSTKKEKKSNNKNKLITNDNTNINNNNAKHAGVFGTDPPVDIDTNVSTRNKRVNKGLVKDFTGTNIATITNGTGDNICDTSSDAVMKDSKVAKRDTAVSSTTRDVTLDTASPPSPDSDTD